MNADGTTALPMPIGVLLNRNGTIRWIDVLPDDGSRPEPHEVLRPADAHLS